MRSFEVITSGVSRPAGRLHPTQDDPDVVAPKVNRFGFLGRSFKHSVHLIVNLIETSPGKLEAQWSLKLDQLCVDGEPHNSSGPTLAPSVVRRGDEPTKGQGFLPAIGLHNLKILGWQPGGRYGVFNPSVIVVNPEGYYAGSGYGVPGAYSTSRNLRPFAARRSCRSFSTRSNRRRMFHPVSQPIGRQSALSFDVEAVLPFELESIFQSFVGRFGDLNPSRFAR
jgi:hypothetical protein